MRHDGARSPGPLVRFLSLLLVDNGHGRRSRSHWGSVSGLRAKPSTRRFGELWAAPGRAASMLPMPQSKGLAAIRVKAAHRTEAGETHRVMRPNLIGISGSIRNGDDNEDQL